MRPVRRARLVHRGSGFVLRKADMRGLRRPRLVEAGSRRPVSMEGAATAAGRGEAAQVAGPRDRRADTDRTINLAVDLANAVAREALACVRRHYETTSMSAREAMAAAERELLGEGEVKRGG